jgi:hypothetical protein
MSTSVNYVGNSYSIPAYGDTGYAQGAGNLSAYLIALATGNFTTAGGAITLTADANLGGSFGLVSLYYKSRTANIATAGIVRLANADLIEWRNAANGGNLTLGVDSSDRLVYNGVIISNAAFTAKSMLYSDAAGVIASTAAPTNGQFLIGSTGNIPVLGTITGTANQIVATLGSGTITLSTPQNIDTAATPTFASETLTATTNQLILGTTRTVTISASQPASSSRVYTIPDQGAAANFLMSAAAQTVAGQQTFTGATLHADGTVSLPGVAFSGDTDCGMYRIGTNNIGIAVNGAKVLDIGTAGLTMVGTIAMGTSKITGLAAATTNGDAVRYEQLNVGVTGGSNPATGNVGQQISSSASSVNAAGSNTWTDITSISLTSGVWDIYGIATCERGAAVLDVTNPYSMGISTASGVTFTNAGNAFQIWQGLVANTTNMPTAGTVSRIRVSISGTTIYYLKARVTITSGTPTFEGYIVGTRV